MRRNKDDIKMGVKNRMGGHGPDSYGSGRLNKAERNRTLKNDSENLVTAAGHVSFSKMSLPHKCSYLKGQ